MNKVKTEDIKKLREKTGAPVMDCKRALEESKGDFRKAEEILNKWGIDRAQKKKEREAKEGLVYAYIHHSGKTGALIEVNCETDFVAKTEDFKKLVHELALQIVSMNPANTEALLKQEYIREPKKAIQQLIDEVIGKLGENIKVARYSRFEIGEE